VAGTIPPADPNADDIFKWAAHRPYRFWRAEIPIRSRGGSHQISPERVLRDLSRHLSVPYRRTRNYPVLRTNVAGSRQRAIEDFRADFPRPILVVLRDRYSREPLGMAFAYGRDVLGACVAREPRLPRSSIAADPGRPG
jgi:hypothetical protein